LLPKKHGRAKSKREGKGRKEQEEKGVTIRVGAWWRVGTRVVLTWIYQWVDGFSDPQDLDRLDGFELDE
jgi:hypothetical protein